MFTMLMPPFTMLMLPFTMLAMPFTTPFTTPSAGLKCL